MSHLVGVEGEGQSAQELFAGPITPTTEAAIAAEEHRPLRVAGSKVLFWPTESQILRRQREMKVAA